MTDTDLIAYFENQDLPQGHFRICSWMTTDNLAAAVASAIEGMKAGNKTSRQNLVLIRTALEG
jgi:hypothetical protein